MKRAGILLITAIIGFTAAWFIKPTYELPDNYAPINLPVPIIHVICPLLYVTENAPDFYWDIADYWTLDDDPTPLTPGSTHPHPITSSVRITYWDNRFVQPVKTIISNIQETNCG